MSSLGKLLGALWFLFVASYYFKYHTYYKADPVIWRGIIFTVLAFALLYAAIWFFQRWRKKSTITLSPLTALVFIFITTLLTLGIFYANLDQGTFTPDQKIILLQDGQYALMDENIPHDSSAQIQFVQGTTVINWGKGKAMFPPEIQALFTSPSVFSFLKGLTENLGILLGIIVLLLAVFHNTGAWILRKKTVSAFGFFESIGVGMGVVMLCIFTLGVFGQLTIGAAWILFGALSVLSVAKYKLLWQTATSKFEIPLAFKKEMLPALFTVTVLLILFALNTASMIRPLPVGFDSLILYHNTASLLVQYQHLIGGIAAYNYELLITWALLLFKVKTAGLFVVYLGGLLALGLLFTMLHKKFGTLPALAWTTFFASLPMVSFLMHIDVKIDMPLLLFSLLAIHQAVKAWPHLKSREGISAVIGTGVFLGIGFGIKYTTAMLVGVIFAFWAYEVWGIAAALGIGMVFLAIFGKMEFWTFANSFSASVKTALIGMVAGTGFLLAGIEIVKRGASWSKVRPFILAGLVMATLMAPWLVKNVVEGKSLNPYVLLLGKNKDVDTQLAAVLADPKTCPAVFVYDELAVYTGNFKGHSLWLPLKTLWEVNINSGLGNSRITDISVLFLGFIVWVLWGWKKAAHEDPTLKRITLFTIFYGVTWLLTSNAIIWYGMPLFWGVIWIYQSVLKKEAWAKVLMGIIMGLGVVVLYAESGAQAEGILYAGKVMDERMFKEQAFSGGEEAEAILNSEEGLKKNILWTGSFLQYLIAENNRRVLGDTYLDNFSCKLMGENPEQTLENLRESNIGYILYSTLILKVEADENGPLHRRFAKFEAFANEHLSLEVYRPKLQLYRVP